MKNIQEQIHKEFEKLYQDIHSPKIQREKTETNSPIKRKFEDSNASFTTNKSTKHEYKSKYMNGSQKNVKFSPKDFLNKPLLIVEKEENENLKPIEENINEIIKMINQTNEELQSKKPQLSPKPQEEEILVPNTQIEEDDSSDEEIIIQQSPPIKEKGQKTEGVIIPSFFSEEGSPRRIELIKDDEVEEIKKESNNNSESEEKDVNIVKKEENNQNESFESTHSEKGVLDKQLLKDDEEDVKEIEIIEILDDETSSKSSIESPKPKEIIEIFDENDHKCKEFIIPNEEELERLELKPKLEYEAINTQDTQILTNHSPSQHLISPVNKGTQDTQIINSQPENDQNTFFTPVEKEADFVYLTPKRDESTHGIEPSTNPQKQTNSSNIKPQDSNPLQDKNMINSHKEVMKIQEISKSNQNHSDDDESIPDDDTYKAITELLCFHRKKPYKRKPSFVSLSFILNLSVNKNKNKRNPKQKLTPKIFLKRNIIEKE